MSSQLKSVHRFFLFSALAILFVSCTNSTNTNSESNKLVSNGPVAKIISTRPQWKGPLTLIIRLPSEPLARVAVNVRVDQLITINVEQEELIAKLGKISSDIKVIYRYKNILNGLFVVVPADKANQIDSILPQGTQVQWTTHFSRPEVKLTKESAAGSTGNLKEHNSVKFIGGEVLHEKGFKGQGMRVGVIDTGIDYTHAMLGGSGLVGDYKKINPSLPSDQFPNNKVVGGTDFVGTDYDSASANPELRIPKPDSNPLDEAGHGSHVSGTIAGVGNGVSNYDGVAPEATLYALKVFGKEGSTDDSVVIAALEYAADPDGNPETQDQLDVVNMSLGSEFGTPKILYKEAISNLNRAGVVVVASAGNSGNVSYITGAPAVSDEALSVAASIDDMEQNWHFGAASFKAADDTDEVLTETAEATFSKPLADIDKAEGKLVYVGKAAVITDEQAALLKGNVALIDRGEIAFAVKVTNALKAGAIAAVVVNNVEGSPFTMGGGSETLDIPAIMISLEFGKPIRDKVTLGQMVYANLKSTKKIAKPNLIDTLTDFSSRGPRSEDSVIKPEISAPGSNIVSAKMGGGSEVVQMSGTSMAGPHIAGVMALIKQAHKDLLPEQLKSLAMLTSKSINDAGGDRYPIAMQGAGRVQVDKAVESGVAVVPASISLGRNEVSNSKTVVRKIQIKNIDNKELTLTVDSKLASDLVLVSPQVITLKAQEQKTVDIVVKLKAPAADKFDTELDGFIYLKDQNQKTYSLPVLAIVLKVSDIQVSKMTIHSTSELDSSGSLVELTVQNKSNHSGTAEIFNLLGTDERKANQNLQNKGLSTACDLESIGYRTVNGKLEMALKLYNPLTTWNTCEFSVQIDADGDGLADQELAGASRANIEGLGKGLTSILMNAVKARELRKLFEAKVAAHIEGPIMDFTEAVQEFSPITAESQTTLMLIQASLAKLKTIPGQKLRIKVGALNLETGTVESDDYLGKSWIEINLDPAAQTVSDLPGTIALSAGESTQLSMTKGEGHSDLIVYFPQNHASLTSVDDKQSKIIESEYKE
jgi:subtilisin family serine protease